MSTTDPGAFFGSCRTIMWYDQYCENYYTRGFKAYSPGAVLDDLLKIDADLYAIYATNQWGLAYYNSDILPKYPPLGDHDYLGEIVQGLCDHGKHTIAYTNWLDSRHPEWRWHKLNADGTITRPTQDLEEIPGYRAQGKGPVYRAEYGEWFLPCINSPRREEILSVAEEIAGRYPVDALHLDMFFNPGICACPYCQAELESMLGGEPITYQAVCDHWGDYLAWRQRQSAALIGQLAEIAHAHGIALAPNSFCPVYMDPLIAVSEHWWPHIDGYVTEAWLRLRQQFADIHSSTITTKWARSVPKPTLFLVTGQHPRFSHYTLARPEYAIHAASAQSNGRPILGSCGQGPYPTTHFSPQALSAARDLFYDYTRRTEGSPRKTAKQIAILWSQDSWAFYEPGEDSRAYRYEFLGYARTLLENHRIFDVLIDSEINTPDDLVQYELLILPNVGCMSDQLAGVIRAYVQHGGKLLASHETSLLDARGRRRDSYALEDVLGVGYQCGFGQPTCYLPDGVEPCPCPSEASVVEPQGADVLHRLIAPDPDYPNEGTGVDLVPGSATDHPLLTRHEYGQGEAWYLAASLGKAIYTYGYFQMTDWLEGLLAQLELAELYHLDAPRSVEIHAERDAASTVYVHLVNLTTPHAMPARDIVRSVDEIVPLHGVRLFLPGELDGASIASEGAEITTLATDGGLWLTVDKLVDSVTISIPTGAGPTPLALLP
jgi:hypothetical protein